MQIILTLSEVLSYQKAMEEWAEKTIHRNYYEDLISDRQAVIGLNVKEYLLGDIAKIEAWIKATPQPKLIPISH